MQLIKFIQHLVKDKFTYFIKQLLKSIGNVFSGTYIYSALPEEITLYFVLSCII